MSEPTSDERALVTEARSLVESWDQRGSWTPDSPVGMVMRLADRIEALEAERDEAERRGEAWVSQAGKQEVRAERAEARLARVKALHRRVYPDYGVPEDGDAACKHCRTDEGGYEMWPCQTIRAIAADEQGRCWHCARTIKSEDGRYWVHTEGLYRGKARCDPDDSGLPYGYNAHPDIASGERVGCLGRGRAADEQEAKQ